MCHHHQVLRFGLLGNGYWASRAHAPGLAHHPEVEFVGVWGRDESKSRALADIHGVTAYREVDDLLRNVDAVSFALPPDIQAQLAVRAAGMGRHLLLEKPLAFDVAQAQSIAEQARRREVKSLVLLSRRYLPGTADFLEQTIAIGGWHGGRVVHRSSAAASKNPYARCGWRPEHGGLWDVGPHALSLLLPVLGRVDQVLALTGPVNTYHVLLKHRGSAASSLELSIDVAPPAAEWSAAFTGELGVRPVPDDHGIRLGDAHHHALGRLISNIDNDVTDDPLDVRIGVEHVAILAAAQASARQGTVLRVTHP
jgi:predicted dehydrogenase